jgi:hypothetical protein
MLMRGRILESIERPKWQPAPHRADGHGSDSEENGLSCRCKYVSPGNRGAQVEPWVAKRNVTVERKSAATSANGDSTGRQYAQRVGERTYREQAGRQVTANTVGEGTATQQLAQLWPRRCRTFALRCFGLAVMRLLVLIYAVRLRQSVLRPC